MFYNKLIPETVMAFQLNKGTTISDIPKCFKVSDFIFECIIDKSIDFYYGREIKMKSGDELEYINNQLSEIGSIRLLRYDYSSEQSIDHEYINGDIGWWLIKYERGLFDLLSSEDFSRQFVKILD